jgi:hypothetical protein
MPRVPRIPRNMIDDVAEAMYHWLHKLDLYHLRAKDAIGEILDWMDACDTPEEAIEWMEKGVLSPYDVKRYKARGLTPADVE